MDDLISRQAAIDAVEKESQIDGAYGYMDTKSIVDLLSDLPSAQPEIIHCRDCKHVEHDKLFHDFWCRGREVEPDHYCGYAERRDNG